MSGFFMSTFSKNQKRVLDLGINGSEHDPPFSKPHFQSLQRFKFFQLLSNLFKPDSIWIKNENHEKSI